MATPTEKSFLAHVKKVLAPEKKRKYGGMRLPYDLKENMREFWIKNYQNLLSKLIDALPEFKVRPVGKLVNGKLVNNVGRVVEAYDYTIGWEKK